MNEIELLTILAKAYNNLDCSNLKAVASDDIIYESQDVFSALEGREEVISYLHTKFLTVRNSTHPVFAEIGFLDNKALAGIYSTSEVNSPCIILAQNTKENKTALVQVKVSDSKISHIVICTVFPHWSQAISTGLYPT